MLFLGYLVEGCPASEFFDSLEFQNVLFSCSTRFRFLSQTVRGGCR